MGQQIGARRVHRREMYGDVGAEEVHHCIVRLVFVDLGNICLNRLWAMGGIEWFSRSNEKSEGQ